jgi:hypothetical protein
LAQYRKLSPGNRRNRKRKVYREAEKWLKLSSESLQNTINKLASVTSKNSWIISEPYYIEVCCLNLITERNYPLSCHFVKRPFTHEFQELYFLNPKAEGFKWWTAKFLDHDLFVFWKRLHSHMLALEQRNVSLEICSTTSNSSSIEVFDISNFMGQVHLIVFCIVCSVITAISVAIFRLQYVIPKARDVLLFVLTKFKHFSFQLSLTIVRFLYLMSRLFGCVWESRNPS